MACIVNITGWGDSVYSYAKVNGRKYTSPASGILLTSNTITLCGYYSTKIDGGPNLTSYDYPTYDWVVPLNVIEINIALNYEDEPNDSGGVSIIHASVVVTTVVDESIKTSTLTISGSPNSSYAYVTVAGNTYSSAGTYVVACPAEISVYVSGDTSQQSSCSITRNGETVQSGHGTYTFTSKAEEIGIDFSRTGSFFTGYAYSATITAEEPTSENVTLVGGVGFLIESGKALISGVEEVIESGKVLANGVEYEIVF